MKTKKILTIILTACFVFMGTNAFSQNVVKDTTNAKQSIIKDKEKLVVVWTSGDRDVALKMVFMYVFNAKKYKWWKDITLLIWGPSAKLLTEDKELQDYLAKMKNIGVNLLACKGCADLYGIADKLETLGVTVRYTGVDFTNFIKSETNVVTF